MNKTSTGNRPYIGLPPLMRRAFAQEDLKPLAAELIDYANTHPEDTNALLDLSTVLLFTGHHDLAQATQAEALKAQQVYTLSAPDEPAVRLLVLKTAGDLMANTPVEFLVEDTDVATTLLYVGADIPPAQEIPDHDVMFVAIGESDVNNPLLEALTDVVRTWPRPVLNLPERIPALARDSASRLLSGLDGVAMPASLRVDRSDLEAVATSTERSVAGLDFPVIIRPVGSHAGHGLQKLDSIDAMTDYCQSVAAERYYVSPFVDYRSADGQFRKYRIMVVQGRPYLCHMAISSHWMIHYLNAGMTDSAVKRDEEALAMQTFNEGFALRHAAAFKAITERVGLDYYGIDCSETPDGQLLIFEVDSNMIVHAMDPVDTFAYKQPPMKKLFTAFRNMLVQAALAHKG